MDEEVITLVAGAIIVNYKGNEVGLLIERFDVLNDARWPMWAWKILWSGSDTDFHRRYQAYTEEGLINLFRDSRFILYKRI